MTTPTADSSTELKKMLTEIISEELTSVNDHIGKSHSETYNSLKTTAATQAQLTDSLNNTSTDIRRSQKDIEYLTSKLRTLELQ